MAEDQKIKLNEQLLSVEEFEEKKKEIEAQKGVKIVEVKPNEYKIQIQG